MPDLPRQLRKVAGAVDPRTVTLIAIAQSANLLKNAFEKKKLAERKDRIKKIIIGDATGQAAKDVVQAAQAAAAMSAIIGATVVTTTAASH